MRIVYCAATGCCARTVAEAVLCHACIQKLAMLF
jgi:hypothetical protein